MKLGIETSDRRRKQIIHGTHLPSMSVLEWQ